jgi:epoxide hydrolase-like predicted phosphatase
VTPPHEDARGAKGLLVDYGGVLTSSAARAFRDFERDMGLPHGTLFELIAEAYREGEGEGPIARVERGETTVAEFTEEMRRRLAARGHEIEVADAAVEIFGRTRRMPDMWGAVRRAHVAGVRTALVSNSWGTDGYPMDDLRAVFDHLVISGEVGLRKPDPEIYLHAADRIGLRPGRCAFVDDLERNVETARELGMFGVVHRDAGTTIAALEDFLGVDLRPR